MKFDAEKITKLLETLNVADEQVHIDLCDEIIDELTNERHESDTERVKGIVEAIAFVTEIRIAE